MHEVSIVEGLIDIVGKQKEKHGFSVVREIHIVCGVYNCTSEENLQFCLATVAKGTYLEGAVIKIRRLVEQWECPACRITFPRQVKAADPSCPQCGSSAAVPLLNSELLLDKLEVD